MSRLWDRLLRAAMRLSAAAVFAALFLLAGWLFAAALPLLRAQAGAFLFSADWRPIAGRFGIAAMLLSSAGCALCAVALATPAALLAALAVRECCPPPAPTLFRSLNRAMAGLPSVLCGLVGMTCIVPAIDRWFPRRTAQSGGAGGLAAILVLALMLLPTLADGFFSALESIPDETRNASRALGAARTQTVFCCLLPSLRASIGLHAGNALRRALGEATAVLLVCGNVVRMPSLFSAQRTLAGTVVLEMGYAAGEHRSALFAIGLVLLLLTSLLPSSQRKR